MIDYFGLVTSLLGFAVILGVAYYAIRLLKTFRRGLLEKGWQSIAISGLLLTGAQVAYFLQSMFPAAGTQLIDAGILLDVLGSIFLLFGLRSHFNSWHIQTKVATGSPEGPLPTDYNT